MKTLNNIKISFENLMKLITVIVTAAIAWGAINTRLSAVEGQVKDLAPVGQQLAVITERVSNVQSVQKEQGRDIKSILRSIRDGQH